MSIVFIEGRNNGYPCIAELVDFPSAAFASPYPDAAWKAGGAVRDGYPHAFCIPEIPRQTEFLPPYPDAVWKVGGAVRDGYPHAFSVPEIPRQTTLLPPYPDFCIYCLGEDFNDGYPCILRLENIERSIFSDIYFGSSEAKELFVGGKTVESAYCNGQKVYGRIYVKNPKS